MGQRSIEKPMVVRISGLERTHTSPRAAFFAQVRSQAFLRLSVHERETTNLYLDQRVHRKGAPLGPAIQRVFADRASVLVFADDHPLENFSHDCRYFLFDAASGELYDERAASFPPYLERVPAGYQTFHYPVPNQPQPGGFAVTSPQTVPMPATGARRHAILFSGSNEQSHLNTLEFCYRTLVDHFGFDTGDIDVLNADKSVKDLYGNKPLWSGGDGLSKFRMKVGGKGDKSAFKAVLKKLKAKISAGDLLFILATGHGFDAGEAALVTNSGGLYGATEFCADLGTLPVHRALIVVMGQCHSGGFNEPVKDASKALETSIAAAAPLGESSHVSSDGCWDSFTRNWIAAQLGQGTDGVPITTADGDGDGSIEAREAFAYADLINATYAPELRDDPQHRESDTAAQELTLGATLPGPLTWSALMGPSMEKFNLLQASPEARRVFLRRALPKLQKLVLPALQKNASRVRAELAPMIEAIIESEFKP